MTTAKKAKAEKTPKAVIETFTTQLCRLTENVKEQLEEIYGGGAPAEIMAFDRVALVLMEQSSLFQRRRDVVLKAYKR